MVSGGSLDHIWIRKPRVDLIQKKFSPKNQQTINERPLLAQLQRLDDPSSRVTYKPNGPMKLSPFSASLFSCPPLLTRLNAGSLFEKNLGGRRLQPALQPPPEAALHVPVIVVAGDSRVLKHQGVEVLPQGFVRRQRPVGGQQVSAVAQGQALAALEEF